MASLHRVCLRKFATDDSEDGNGISAPHLFGFIRRQRNRGKGYGKGEGERHVEEDVNRYVFLQTFATGGKLDDVPLPGLSVTGIGPIGLPLSDAQAKLVIKKSTQASKTDEHNYTYNHGQTCTIVCTETLEKWFSIDILINSGSVRARRGDRRGHLGPAVPPDRGDGRRAGQGV